MLKMFKYSWQTNIGTKFCLIALILHLTLPFIHVLDLLESDSLSVKADSTKIHQQCQHLTYSSFITTIGQNQRESGHDSAHCPICSIILSSRKLAVLNSSNALVTTKLFVSFSLDVRTNFPSDTLSLTSPRSPPFIL